MLDLESARSVSCVVAETPNDKGTATYNFILICNHLLLDLSLPARSNIANVKTAAGFGLVMMLGESQKLLLDKSSQHNDTRMSMNHSTTS